MLNNYKSEYKWKKHSTSEQEKITKSTPLVCSWGKPYKSSCQAWALDRQKLGLIICYLCDLISLLLPLRCTYLSNVKKRDLLWWLNKIMIYFMLVISSIIGCTFYDFWHVEQFFYLNVKNLNVSCRRIIVTARHL